MKRLLGIWIVLIAALAAPASASAAIPSVFAEGLQPIGHHQQLSSATSLFAVTVA